MRTGWSIFLTVSDMARENRQTATVMVKVGRLGHIFLVVKTFVVFLILIKCKNVNVCYDKTMNRVVCKT